MPRPLLTITTLLLCTGCVTYPADPGILSDTDANADAGPGPDSAEASTGDPVDGSTSDGAVDGSSDGGDPPPSDSGSVPGEGLPCEIDQFLTSYCRSCHSGSPPISTTIMLSRADMLADSTSAPGHSVGEVSVQRFDDPALPMPPLPASPPPAEERAAFADWVSAGMPAGDCTAEPPGPDPFDVEPMCSSGQYWMGGLFGESPHMDPGRTCVSCHEDPFAFGGDEDEAPYLYVGGTVFPTGHEPDDCFGFDGTNMSDAYIEVTDAGGTTVTLPINAAGNFYLRQAPPGFGPPYLTKIVVGDEERAMSDPAPHGDCNLCHTQEGDDDALGRIIPPW